MWKPLAAISYREEDISSSTLSNSEQSRTSSHFAIPKRFTAAITTSSLARSLPISVMDDKNDVWHRIIFDSESNSIFALNDTDINITNLLCNLTNFGNCTTNETNTKEVVSWHLVTVIGTATILGLLILATVIGKCNLS